MDVTRVVAAVTVYTARRPRARTSLHRALALSFSLPLSLLLQQHLSLLLFSVCPGSVEPARGVCRQPTRSGRREVGILLLLLLLMPFIIIIIISTSR